MSRVLLNITGLNTIQARLTELGLNLPELLLPANTVIAEQTEAVIAELYPNMVQEWKVSINKYPGGVASVMAESTDMLVRWYEYGTAAHEIDPVTGQALAFAGTHNWSGQMVITGHVEHPGAIAHNRGATLLAEMGAVARSVWGEELNAIITNFEV